MKKELKLRAIELRREGYSIKELHKLLEISKATASAWVQGIELSPEAEARLRQNYTNGQLASMKTTAEKTRQKNSVADDFAENIIRGLNMSEENVLVLCALIYQCEGNKNVKTSVTFTNSDPNLMATFINLFRRSFSLDESKFRVLMHLHAYHNEKTQKDFWSRVTKVPKEQFNKSYLKPTTGKYKKEGYQGCIQLRYRDVVIGRKMHAVAKMFMERYK